MGSPVAQHNVLHQRNALLLGALVSLCLSPALLAESLQITSTPSGATVEIDGKIVGTTPYTSNKLPGGLFS